MEADDVQAMIDDLDDRLEAHKDLRRKLSKTIQFYDNRIMFNFAIIYMFIITSITFIGYDLIDKLIITGFAAIGMAILIVTRRQAGWSEKYVNSYEYTYSLMLLKQKLNRILENTEDSVPVIIDQNILDEYNIKSRDKSISQATLLLHTAYRRRKYKQTNKIT